PSRDEARSLRRECCRNQKQKRKQNTSSCFGIVQGNSIYRTCCPVLNFEHQPRLHVAQLSPPGCLDPHVEIVHLDQPMVYCAKLLFVAEFANLQSKTAGGSNCN